MRSLVTRAGLAGLAPLTLLLASGCDQPPASEVDSTQQPIYGGDPVANIFPTGVVQVSGFFNCTGTIYRQYWVLTAAHCFPRDLDWNGDGVISTAQGEWADTYWVGPVPSSSTTWRSLKAWAIYRHPDATWGEANGINRQDAALIFLDPSSTGAATSTLDTSRYTNGVLNIYGGTLANLLGKTVQAMGYGPDGYGGDSGILRSANKYINRIETGWYGAVALGSLPTFRLAGPSCPGDSGGPDYLWDGVRWGQTGIHSTGSIPLCTGLGDQQPVAGAWAPWVRSTTATCPATTRSGTCHF